MKRKQVTKLMAAVLATVMAVGFTGCGDQPSNPGSSDPGSSEAPKSDAETPEQSSEESSSEEEEVGKYTVLTDENGNVYDLGGMHIIMRDWFTSDAVNDNPSAYDEAREDYMDWIQETYNFTFERKNMSGWGDVPTDYSDYVISGGDDTNYIFVLRTGAEYTGAMQSGLMYDLSTLDCLDFSESKWKSDAHKKSMLGDAIYGMSGEFPEPKGGVYFNKRVLEEAGINTDELYQLQENMEWTWEKFEELCEKVAADTDGDGVLDRYAMANFSACWYPMSVYSNNGQFIQMDNAGKLYSSLETDEVLEALNWAMDMWDRYDAHPYYPEGAEWSYWITCFVEGHAGFNADEVYRAGQFQENNMEDDFGFVCFPRGPRATDYANAWNNNPVVIPACYDADRAWKLAFVYNLYTEPTIGFDDSVQVKYNYYKSFCDLESVDLSVVRLTQSGFPNYEGLTDIDFGGTLYWAINKDNTPAQQAEACREVWQSKIDEANGRGLIPQ